MALKLYTVPFCPYCDRIRDALARLNLAYDEISIVGLPGGRDEVARLSGQRRVPVLVDGERVVHDSARILAYLDENHSGANGHHSDRPQGGSRWRIRRRP